MEPVAVPALVVVAELVLLGIQYGLPAGEAPPLQSMFSSYEWAYAALFLVGFCAAMLAVTTSNINKRRQAMYVCSDGFANAFGLVLCGVGATYVPISPAGLRMPWGLFVMETMQPITALFTVQASLRVILAESGEVFAGRMRLMRAVIFLRSAFGLASIAIRYNPQQPAIWLLWVGVAVLYIASTTIVRVVHAHLSANSPKERRSWRSALPLTVAMSLAPAAVALVVLGDAAYVYWGLSAEIAEALMTAGLVLRSGQALMVLLVTWSVNDEGRISERDAALVRQKLALQEQRDAERLKQIRYVTHEVRGPLNCILLGLQSLREAAAATAAAQQGGAAAPALTAAGAGGGGGVYLDDEARESLTVMTSAAEGMLATVSDLLDLAKAEAGAFAINMQPMSLAKLVRSVAAQVAPYAHADRVDVSWEVHPAVPPWALGDPLRLSQSLLNFVSNAIKFVDHGGKGRIVITVEPEPRLELRADGQLHRVCSAAGGSCIVCRGGGCACPPDQPCCCREGACAHGGSGGATVAPAKQPGALLRLRRSAFSGNGSTPAAATTERDGALDSPRDSNDGGGETDSFGAAVPGVVIEPHHSVLAAEAAAAAAASGASEATASTPRASTPRMGTPRAGTPQGGGAPGFSVQQQQPSSPPQDGRGRPSKHSHHHHQQQQLANNNKSNSSSSISSNVINPTTHHPVYERGDSPAATTTPSSSSPSSSPTSSATAAASAQLSAYVIPASTSTSSSTPPAAAAASAVPAPAPAGAVYRSQDGQAYVTTGTTMVLRITCRDNGVGIDRRGLSTLYRAFMQLNAGQSYKGRSSGLGLAIVREIVAKHGGRVGASSAVGVGSDFFMSVPFQVLAPVGGSSSSGGGSAGTGGASAVGASAHLSCVPSLPLLAGPPAAAASPVHGLGSGDVAIAIGGAARQLPAATSSAAPAGGAVVVPRLEIAPLAARTRGGSGGGGETGAQPAPALLPYAGGSISRHARFAPPTVGAVGGSGSGAATSSSSSDVGGGSAADVQPAAAYGGLADGSGSGHGAGSAWPDAALLSPQGPPPQQLQHQSQQQPYVILQQHGGSGGATGQPGALPSSPAPAPAAPPLQEALRVLVVDDVKSNRYFLVMLLRRMLPPGSVIEQAADGSDAVEMVRERGVDAFHVIALDFEMPMSGPATAALLRGMGVRGLIVGVTGNALPEDIAAFRSAGADEVLTKPVDMARFKAVVAERVGLPPRNGP